MGLTVGEKGSLDAVWLPSWVWGEREESGGMVVPLAHCEGEGLLIVSGIQKDRPRVLETEA